MIEATSNTEIRATEHNILVVSDLHFGEGMCEPGLDPYMAILLEQRQPAPNQNSLLKRLGKTWHWQTLVTVRYLIRRPFRLLLSFYYPFEGDHHILWVERQVGRFLGILKRRKTYDLDIQEIRNAAWRRI